MIANAAAAGMNLKRTMAQTPPDAKTISYAQWKAWELNELFEQQGRAKQKGNLWPDTVTHGEKRETTADGK